MRFATAKMGQLVKPVSALGDELPLVGWVDRGVAGAVADVVAA